MRAVIIANGNPPAPGLIRRLAAGALLICADGGAYAAQAAGLTPDWVIGDLDSLDDATLDTLHKKGTLVRRFPPCKDETDLELALLHAAERGVEEITVLGALGGRVDQLLGNIQLLALPALERIPTRILDDGQEISLIRGEATIHGEIGDAISLLPLGGDAVGIETDGLEWALGGSTLKLGRARGISNRLTKPIATIRVASGLLLAVRLLNRPNEEDSNE